MKEPSKKILIVEDEVLIAFQLEEQLERFGYKVVSHVTSGEEVLEEVKKHLPDLIMMDINLKGKMSGIEAAHKIRTFSNIPIIFLTAYGDDKMLEEAKLTSPHGFLTKPFRSQELNAAIELGLIRHKTEEDLRKKQEHFEKISKGNDNPLWTTVPDLMDILFVNPSHDQLWENEKEILSSISKNIEKLKEHQDSIIETKNERDISKETKDNLLSRISHEFRTPLNSIMGFSQILHSETENPLSDSQKEKLDKIIHSGNRILRLVDNMLDQKIIEKNNLEINFEDVSINRLIEESFVEVQELSKKKKLSITSDIPSNEEIWVSADPTHLKKIFTHLLINAINYNRQYGALGISLKLNDSQFAQLHISDTGTGISPEKQKQIFKPFNTISPNSNYEEGMGLSLSISKLIIEKMDGRIFFKSQFGKGSIFSIELPFVKKTPAPSNQSSNIKSYNAIMERETNNEEADFSKVSIPKEMFSEFLNAAEIYNYTKLDCLIKELSSYSEGGKSIARLARECLNQYNVEKIIELLNKTKHDS